MYSHTPSYLGTQEPSAYTDLTCLVAINCQGEIVPKPVAAGEGGFLEKHKDALADEETSHKRTPLLQEASLCVCVGGGMDPNIMKLLTI